MDIDVTQNDNDLFAVLMISYANNNMANELNAFNLKDVTVLDVVLLCLLLK